MIRGRCSISSEVYCVRTYDCSWLTTEYVQVKPILVLATTIFKATGTYHEGEFKVTSGYTYVSIVYNISICTSL